MGRQLVRHVPCPAHVTVVSIWKETKKKKKKKKWTRLLFNQTHKEMTQSQNHLYNQSEAGHEFFFLLSQLEVAKGEKIEDSGYSVFRTQASRYFNKEKKPTGDQRGKRKKRGERTHRPLRSAVSPLSTLRLVVRIWVARSVVVASPAFLPLKTSPSSSKKPLALSF